jgi:mannose-6-phosphate isomerase-like protein (cupin superfamily)
MQRMRALLGGVVVIAMGQMLMAQATVAPANRVDYHSAAQMEAQAKKLLAEAGKAPTGVATATLDSYPGHYVVMIARVKSGVGELHRQENDVFVVVDGDATVLTGGTMVDPKDTAPGEVRGTRVDGGVAHELHKGDLFHVPPNVPHQTILAPGKTFTYYVVKVVEPKS